MTVRRGKAHGIGQEEGEIGGKPGVVAQQLLAGARQRIGLAQALLGLRDVEDVHGSFLIGGDGRLLARDLPAVFRDELFADVGPRLVRLRETSPQPFLRA